MREMWRKGLFTRYLQLFRGSRCQMHGADPPLLRWQNSYIVEVVI
jgi:hypothetical protein